MSAVDDSLDELLRTDPGAARCYAFLIGADVSFDALCACYGGDAEPESAAQQVARAVGVTTAQAQTALDTPGTLTPTSADEEAEFDQAWEVWREWCQ